MTIVHFLKTGIRGTCYICGYQVLPVRNSRIHYWTTEFDDWTHPSTYEQVRCDSPLAQIAMVHEE